MRKTFLKRFQSKTPKFMIRIGNALLGISTTITGFAFYADNGKLALIALISGVLGKIITSLFVEDDFKRYRRGHDEGDCDAYDKRNDFK